LLIHNRGQTIYYASSRRDAFLFSKQLTTKPYAGGVGLFSLCATSGKSMEIQTMYIETALEANNGVGKSALRSTANSALMRARGIALRLANIAVRTIGNGIDGYNDMHAARDAARQAASWFNDTGKAAEPLEDTMQSLMALYYSLADRLSEEEFFAPMTIPDAFRLMSAPQGAEVDSESEIIKALAEISGESVEKLLERKEKEQAKSAARNADMTPLAMTFLEECGGNGADEDAQFDDLPLNIRFAIFCKAIDGAANQYDRDLSRAMKFSDSKSAVLRSLAVSDTAAGKNTLNDLEASLTKFIQQHKSELDM